MQFTKENAYALANNMFEGFGENSSSVDVLEFLLKCEENSMFVKPRKPGSGRKDGLTKFKIVEILREAEETGVASSSRTYLERLVDKGYLEKHAIQTGKRGRQPVEYRITGKGRGYLALSKNWNME